MSQVVDSLKRLERVGSENSKTTQKLVEAADRLAAVIVQQFDVPDRYEVDVAPSFTRTRYSILNGRLCNGQSRYVAENRDTALAFAKDVAIGLVDGIVESLEHRNNESRAALDAVKVALERIGPGVSWPAAMASSSSSRVSSSCVSTSPPSRNATST